MEQFKYQIGDKVYIQKPLVLGQIRQFLNALKGLTIPKDVNVFSIIDALGDKLPGMFAIVLTPESINLKDKNLEELSKEIEFNIDPEMTMKVIEDFFTCNIIPSLLERFSGVMMKVTKSISKTGSKNSVSSSQEEILPNGIPSSGDTPLGSASPISSSDREK